ncbi:MAG: hypothetical protein A2161_12260 [Candidatus Schekmanbacteria bacterium RBG_13_48_7]|uniref:Uncharacterized protein n=1 Tax=Candidatus Schekmanbacteria bacterium RBG_13_48_7 TaxID=1817878 RepID=A0A1F7S0J7_9BACT|nr:MAG: hypothetical protein A2161_12260 [Candidatus Schekmanbacteria bacterium RBG_13_48_7]
MKINKWELSICVLFFICIIFPKNVHPISNENREFHFTLLSNYGISFPLHTFEKNYKSIYGFSEGIGLTIINEELTDTPKKTFLLKYQKNKFELQNEILKIHEIIENKKAFFSGIYFGYQVEAPFFSKKNLFLTLFETRSLGGSRFSIDQRTFEYLGRSTLTELIQENDKVQFSDSRGFGCAVTFQDHYSFQLSYDFINVEKVWLFGHSLLSTAIHYEMIDGVPFIIKKISSDNFSKSLTFRIIIFFYRIGSTILLENFDYDHHNWPFDDLHPIKYHQLNFTFCLYF